MSIFTRVKKRKINTRNLKRQIMTIVRAATTKKNKFIANLNEKEKLLGK